MLDLDEAQQRVVDSGDVSKLAIEISDLNKALDRWCRWQDDMIAVLKGEDLYDRITPLLGERYRMGEDDCRYVAELRAAREVIKAVLDPGCVCAPPPQSVQDATAAYLKIAGSGA